MSNSSQSLLERLSFKRYVCYINLYLKMQFCQKIYFILILIFDTDEKYEDKKRAL